MIKGIDLRLEKDILEAREVLYDKLKLARVDKSTIADYLDYFDTRCVPLAIKALPSKSKKQYKAKIRDLMNGLDSLKKSVGKDERKMHSHIGFCAYRFNKFTKSAFEGPASLSTEPLEQLFQAEFSSTIARIVHGELEPKFRKEIFKDEESEQ